MAKLIKQVRKRRAMTTENARRVKLAGHEVEREFAVLIGGYKYPGSRKKDVVDTQGNIHSVKSGDKKWQIFLYGKSRFQESIGFLGANLFIKCIDNFPIKRSDYVSHKEKFKIDLQQKMRVLKEFFSKTLDSAFLHSNKLIFLQEALFHSSEVDYLTVKDGGVFHIFDAQEVIRVLDDATVLVNSKAAQKDQTDDQKVVFKLRDTSVTIGEIEVRNDSPIHYRQIKFWMDKDKTLTLLKSNIRPVKKKSEKIFSYGKAISRFKIL